MDCDNNNRPGVEHGKSFFLGNGTMVMFLPWKWNHGNVFFCLVQVLILDFDYV
jgi:hypothetical protein